MDFLKDFKKIQFVDAYICSRKPKLWQSVPRNLCSFGCRISGKSTFKYGDTVVTADAPDTVYIPANMSYLQQSFGDELAVIHFTVTDTEDSEITLLPAEIGKNISAFTEICSAFSENTVEGRFRAQALFFHLLSRLAFFYAESKDVRIKEALRYMHSHYSEPELNIEEIAAHLHISSVFLRRLFRQQINTSPIKKLTSIRIEEAKRMLIQSDMPISEISGKCGFSEAKYFAKVFQDSTGNTASGYRQWHR